MASAPVPSNSSSPSRPAPVSSSPSRPAPVPHPPQQPHLPTFLRSRNAQGCLQWRKPAGGGGNPPPPPPPPPAGRGGAQGCLQWWKPAAGGGNPPPPPPPPPPAGRGGAQGCLQCWKPARGSNVNNGDNGDNGRVDAKAHEKRLKSMRILLFSFFVFSTAILAANWTGTRMPDLKIVLAAGVVCILSVALLVALELVEVPKGLMSFMTVLAGIAAMALIVFIVLVEIKLSKGAGSAPAPAPAHAYA